MRTCDLCGAPLAETEPFATCARCLLTAALDGPSAPTVSREPAVAADAVFPSRLQVRPDFFDKYDIRDRVAGGGQGEIWRVWDLELRRPLAMKRLSGKSSHSPAVVYRFLAEAQIASQLDHPGVLPVFDVGLDPDGRAYYTTQLLPGTTLADIWRKVHDRSDDGWTLHRALDALIRVCEIMSEAHSRGVVHRDLKPPNILVGAFGDIRVIDWGSALVLDRAQSPFAEPFVSMNREFVETDRDVLTSQDPASPLASTGSGRPLTLVFVPPELLRGEPGEAGPQTDIYSLGVMLYHLLAGKLPYSKDDGALPPPAELRRLILAGPPVALRALNRSISRDFAAIASKAMAGEKTERYVSTQALAEDLRAALEIRPVVARGQGRLLRAQKWLRRNALPLALVSLVAAALSVSFGVARGLRVERDVARQVTALRTAELAARTGRWQAALTALAEAEAAGYRDVVDLGLQRVSVWTALSDAERSGRELKRLARRADLGGRRATVLLRLGHHQLFTAASVDVGIRHVREALHLGLSGADDAFAEGLLAESTVEALEAFHQSLRLDPFHHDARLASVGLEHLLGRRDELAENLRVYAALFPDDPTPGMLRVGESAMQGNLVDARALLHSLRGKVADRAWTHMDQLLPLLAETATNCALESVLKTGRLSLPHEAILERAGIRPEPQGASSPEPGGRAEVRVARLPCLEKGVLEGATAVHAIRLPFLADIESAVARVRASWRFHPNALVPALAAAALEDYQGTNGPRSLKLMELQAELYQMAAGSPSVFPGLQRTARYLAARSQFELSRSTHSNAHAARTACLNNLRSALRTGEMTVPEVRAYLVFAAALDAFQPMRELLGTWEDLQPGDPFARRARIELETRDGNLLEAWRLTLQILLSDPEDAWALNQRRRIHERLQIITESITTGSLPPP